MNLSSASSTPFARSAFRPSPVWRHHPAATHRARPGASKPTLDLARACAREVATGAQIDSGSLLFLGGCAASVLVGCAVHMERFVAHWDSFESFVRALVA